MFFVPQYYDEYKDLAELITENGGCIVDQYEVYTLQIIPESSDFNNCQEDFYVGPVYSSKYLYDLIANKIDGNGKDEDKEEEEKEEEIRL